jgi:hypothetical protein
LFHFIHLFLALGSPRWCVSWAGPGGYVTYFGPVGTREGDCSTLLNYLASHGHVMDPEANPAEFILEVRVRVSACVRCVRSGVCVCGCACVCDDASSCAFHSLTLNTTGDWCGYHQEGRQRQR